MEYRERLLTEEEVYECRLRYAMGESMPALAEEKGISRTAIRFAVRGRTYKHCMRVPPVLPGVCRNMCRKASPELVRRIRAEHARRGNLKALARKTGLAYGSVWKIVRGETFKWVSSAN